MKFEQAPKREEETRDSEQEEKKNPFDLSKEELDKLYADNDNSELYKN